jgi:DNA-binding MarR family transcriptional regulator
MRQSEALAIGEVCMGLHLRRAARQIARTYDDALAPVDLTIGQFSLMTVLAGQESWGMQPLADVLGTDRSSLTATLKPLERRKLVESSNNSTDKRVRQLALTTAGMQLLEQALPLWDAAQAQTTKQLGVEDAAHMRNVLKRLT